MPEPLTLVELQLVERLTTVGVLKKIDPNGIKGRENGAIPVFCGDQRQSPDILDYINRRITNSLFLFAFPGGALLIPENSPLNRDFPHGTGLSILLGIAHNLEPDFPILLKVHAPCRMARLHGLTLIDEIKLCKEAKQRLLREIPKLSDEQITCHLHVDMAPHATECDRRKMWFISGPVWQQWLQSEGDQWQQVLREQQPKTIT